uniref:Copia protein n=1 Tax=Tanacetum cinerariifolium TaxID=118510 RepID=A0A6L2M2S8_TANCI|nr:copia protein [Tanacetum cinerariifolium]
MEKDSEIYKGKKKRVKSIALKAKKESSDDETLTSRSDDEEYAMAVKNFKKFFRIKGKFVRQPREEKKLFRQKGEKKERVTKNDLDAVIQIISLAIVQNNLATKIKRPSLEVLGAIAKMMPNTKLTMKLVSWLNRQMSANSLREMLNNQKSSCCKTGLGFDSSKASTSGTKPISFVGLSAENATDESTIKIKEMLKKFGLEDTKPTKTPMSMEIKLTKDDEVDSMDSSRYRENTKTTHFEAVKRIFRYVRGTTHSGLWYPKGTGVETIVYADSDHTGDYVDRKSTIGVCTFIGCCLTSWFTKKQTTLAISSTEAEYVSAGKESYQRKGKRVASPSVTFSSSSSSDDNEAPPFPEFYEELFDNKDLTNA